MAATSIDAPPDAGNPFRPDPAAALAGIYAWRIALAFALLAAAFVLTGCGTNLLGRKEGPPPELQLQGELSPGLRKPCDKPVAVPDRLLKDWEITEGWNADRAALRKCGLRQQATVRQHDIITGKIPIPEPRPLP